MVTFYKAQLQTQKQWAETQDSVVIWTLISNGQ